MNLLHISSYLSYLFIGYHLSASPAEPQRGEEENKGPAGQQHKGIKTNHWAPLGKKNPIVDPPNQTVKEQEEGKAGKGGK